MDCPERTHYQSDVPLANQVVLCSFLSLTPNYIDLRTVVALCFLQHRAFRVWTNVFVCANVISTYRPYRGLTFSAVTGLSGPSSPRAFCLMDFSSPFFCCKQMPTLTTQVKISFSHVSFLCVNCHQSNQNHTDKCKNVMRYGA